MFWSILIASLSALLFPVVKSTSERNIQFEKLRNFCEGFFFSQARHSLYNAILLSKICRDDLSSIRKYDFEKQAYECNILEDRRRELVDIFPPKFSMIVQQYLLLVRNFDIDLKRLIEVLRNTDSTEEEIYKAMQVVLNKNIRLLLISDTATSRLNSIRRIERIGPNFSNRRLRSLQKMALLQPAIRIYSEYLLGHNFHYRRLENSEGLARDELQDLNKEETELLTKMFRKYAPHMSEARTTIDLTMLVDSIEEIKNRASHSR